ncbi:MAG: chemotaxis protein CheW [Gammaproteobacteria bacterium]|nr:chemotaxis protein CheW [Gammaproteobacteria bacterium]MBQ0840514.1 chemotaxis protein CheW [Gammaproteobacteria bacterium]
MSALDSMEEVDGATIGDGVGGAEEISQFLTFELASEIYAINILFIREIIEYGNLTQVPMVPNFIAGVINLRGSVVPVIDLSSRFGRSETKITKRTSIVIIEINSDNQMIEIGIMVDIVNEVLEMSDDAIEDAPSFGASIRTDFISGMGKVDGKFLIILNVEQVLSLDELSVVSEISLGGPENVNIG